MGGGGGGGWRERLSIWGAIKTSGFPKETLSPKGFTNEVVVKESTLRLFSTTIPAGH